MAAAGFQSKIAQILINHGANCAAKNRRGAEPVHYASDCNTWNPAPQVATIQCLIRAGADLNTRPWRSRSSASCMLFLLDAYNPVMFSALSGSLAPCSLIAEAATSIS